MRVQKKMKPSPGGDGFAAQGSKHINAKGTD